MIENINILAVAMSVLAHMIVGYLWYSPFLFGKMWMQALGMKEMTMSDDKKPYLYTMLTAVVMAIVLSILLEMTGANTVDKALEVGFLVWLGFVATTNYLPVVFEKRSVQVYALGIGYQLVSLLIMSMILTSWK